MENNDNNKDINSVEKSEEVKIDETVNLEENIVDKASSLEEKTDENFEEDISGVEKKDPKIIENEIRKLISSGHMFKAHEMAKKAFDEYHDDIGIRQTYALALLKTGSITETRKLIYPLIGLDYSEYENAEALNVININALRNSKFVKSADADILSDLANIFKEAWTFSRSCQDLEVGRELYFASFERADNPHTGTQAAWLFWLTGDDDLAKTLAEKVLKLLPPLGISKSFNELVNLAETQLLLGRAEDAIRLYEEAMKYAPSDYIPIVHVRTQLQFFKSAGFKIPNEVFDVLTPPTIVVFTGYAIDHHSFKLSVFPHELEDDVKAIIVEKLNNINAKVGYSSASCGADLLFIEAMLERGAEVNIILPFAISDFLESNVRHAGPRWEKRFEKAIEKAHTVSLAAEDRYLGHDMLFRFSNNVMHGTAVMRGKFLTTEPHLMAVWHSRNISTPGGPSDFIDRWSDISTLHLIDLDEIKASEEEVFDPELIKKITPNYLEFDPFIDSVPDRLIKSMMFSDLAGYSKLQDEHIPAFLDFMNHLYHAMDKIGFKMESINTWGDAVFAVGDSAISIAEFGLKYCDIIEQLGKNYTNFPQPIRARISLHSGPVFVANDPFINKINFYGGHINRAARLEPVTTVGQVYATQQFVSLLHTEISSEEHESKQVGMKYYNKFATEYVGVISLAKNFGQQEVYHLRWNC